MLHLLVLFLSLASAVQSVLLVLSSSSAAPQLGLAVLLLGLSCAPSHRTVNFNFYFREKQKKGINGNCILTSAYRILSYFHDRVRTVFLLDKGIISKYELEHTLKAQLDELNCTLCWFGLG